MLRRSFRPLAVVVASTMLFSACTDQLRSDSGDAGGGSSTVKIGYVSPQTGALAPFGEADAFVVDQMRKHFKDRGITIGGERRDVEIIVKDSQSDAKRASDVAAALILQDDVDLLLVASTPDTTNPVADQGEANGVPVVSTVAPWQPYFFGRKGDARKPFQWTYHFFWGLEDVETVYQDMWDAVDTNKILGAIWPNDPDGNAWGDARTGFPPVVAKRGYETVDPGHYANGTQDFSAQISTFKSRRAEILAGVPIPPDFTTFWKQAAQQGYRPKIATIGKALLFPSTIDALGDLGHNLGTEVWWSPSHPYESTLTGQSAQQLAASYTKQTGKPWTQPIGFVHALFETAVAALQQSDGSKTSVAKALSRLTELLRRIAATTGRFDKPASPTSSVWRQRQRLNRRSAHIGGIAVGRTVRITLRLDCQLAHVIIDGALGSAPCN